MGYYESKAIIDNLAYELSMIGTRIEAYYASKKALNELMSKKEEVTTDKKTEKQVEKLANEAFKQDQTSELTNSIVLTLNKLTKDDTVKAMKLTMRALSAAKLIQFAYFYMTDERAELLKLSTVDREIVNGIAARFDFGKIYESAGVSNLKAYDLDYPNDYLEFSKYLLSIKDIDNKKSDQVFMERMKVRKESLLVATEHPEDDVPEVQQNPINWNIDSQGIVHPVFENVSETAVPLHDRMPLQGNGVTEDMYKLLEETFAPLTNERRRYETYGDLFRMYILRNTGIEEWYIVDPGIMMGLGKISLLANLIDNSSLFVSVADHPDICKNVLSSSFYSLTQDEMQIALNDCFRNINIYRYLDMSNTVILKDISKDKFQLLGKKMTFILNYLVNQNTQGIDLPRFRFKEFNSVDDFTIVSDSFVRSPLSWNGFSSLNIVEGMEFECKGDNVTQKYGNNIISLHIDRYGEM